MEKRSEGLFLTIVSRPVPFTYIPPTGNECGRKPIAMYAISWHCRQCERIEAVRLWLISVCYYILPGLVHFDIGDPFQGYTNRAARVGYFWRPKSALLGTFGMRSMKWHRQVVLFVVVDGCGKYLCSVRLNGRDLKFYPLTMA